MALDLYKNVGKFKIYKPGETLFQQGESGDCMYIVTKGVFSVYINNFADLPMKVADVTEGAFLGEMSVIDGSPRSATVVSAKQGVAISIDKKHFGDLLEEYPDTAEKILETLIQRFESTAAIVQASGNTIEELPIALKSGGDYNSKIAFDSMCFLAKRIRELNSLINPQDEKTESLCKRNTEQLKLLPEGHGEFSGSDKLDNSKLLSQRDFTCPYCGEEFKGYVPVFTRLQEKEKTIDGRVVYRNFNILFYQNVVCAKCNYCDIYNEFLQKGKPLMRTGEINGIVFENVEKFTGYKNELTHTLQEAILSYYLNIQCLRQIPNSMLRIAKSWQRLYWLYFHNSHNYSPQHEKWALFAAKNAAELFEQFLTENKAVILGESLLNLNTILGELYVALGETEKARSYFKANTQVLGFLTHELAEKCSARLRGIGG